MRRSNKFVLQLFGSIFLEVFPCPAGELYVLSIPHVGLCLACVYSSSSHRGRCGCPSPRGVLENVAYNMHNPDKLEPMRLRSQRGSKETVSMISIRVISNSHAFIVGTEDGQVKICN